MIVNFKTVLLHTVNKEKTNWKWRELEKKEKTKSQNSRNHFFKMETSDGTKCLVSTFERFYIRDSWTISPRYKNHVSSVNRTTSGDFFDPLWTSVSGTMFLIHSAKSEPFLIQCRPIPD